VPPHLTCCFWPGSYPYPALSQGAGKGTQSSRIQDNFEVNSISSGDLLRKNIAQGTAVGKRAAKEMKNGAFVSDEVMVQLIDAELNKLGADQSWLLDGFPRTMAQARTLDRTLQEVNQPLNLVIHLNVPEDVILQRIMGKKLHAVTRVRHFHSAFSPGRTASNIFFSLHTHRPMGPHPLG